MANKKLTRNPNYALRLRDAQDKGLIITKNEGDRFGYLASGIDFSNINNQEMANSIIVNTFDKINQYFDSYRELAIIDQIKDTRYRCTFNKEETKKKFKKLVDDIQSICNKTKELYQKTNLDYDRNDMDKSIRNFTEVYAVSMFSNHKLMNENILKQAKSLI